MISRKAKYAVRAALFLAENHGKRPVTVEKIAQEEGISLKFLETIMQELRQGGILRSHRGKYGGYELRDHPANITVGRVIRLIDGPLAPVRCVSATAYAPCADCPSEEECKVRLVMKDVREAISRVLDLKSLDHILHEFALRNKLVSEPLYSI